jgi:hypothetical protein
MLETTSVQKSAERSACRRFRIEEAIGSVG